MFRNVTVALMAFLTLVDLFATQAILPTLAQAYRVSPAAMGLAVNASTIGMAIAGLVVALAGRRLDRRVGVAVSLALLALPTAALALAPDLTTFAALRIVQGLAMSTAFALTLSYLAEHCSMRAAAGAFAAYVTGNVASNLFGRLMSASLAEHFGLSGNFVVFAALNLAGAVLAWFTLARHAADARGRDAAGRVVHADRPLAQRGAAHQLRDRLPDPVRVHRHLHLRELRAGARADRAVADGARPGVLRVPAALVTTPLAGRAIQRYGTQRAFRVSLLVAGLGLPLLLLPSLGAVVIGLACVGAGTFFAQATATGFVGRAATDDPGSASGMYLASYFSGGLVGAAVVGQLFQHAGWPAAVAAVGVALALAAWLARGLVTMPAAAHEADTMALSAR